MLFTARACTLVALLTGPMTVQADDAQDTAPLRHISVSVSGDDNESRQVQGDIGLPLGRSGWTELSLGSLEVSLDGDEIDTLLAAGAIGFDTRHVSGSLSYAQREDSDSFEQQDLAGSLTFRFGRGGLGLNLFHRSAESETMTSIERRRRDPLALRIVQSADGEGYGGHGYFDVTPAFTVSASYMAYDYDVSNNRPLLSRTRLFSFSGITRDEAFIDESLTLGVTYRLASVTLDGYYFRDRSLATGDITDTFEFSLMQPLGDSWMLYPWVGYSASDEFDSVLSGGVQLSWMW